MRSLYGVLGTWTTIFHDFDDPVGMIAMQANVASAQSSSNRPVLAEKACRCRRTVNDRCNDNLVR